MIDPLSEVVGLLQPGMRFTKIVGAAGRWGVRRTEMGQPSYCVVLDGTCRLAVAGSPPLTLEPGDFVLIPATYDFSMSSLRPPPARDFDRLPVQVAPGQFRVGAPDLSSDVRFLIGQCTFGSPNAALLVSLLRRNVASAKAFFCKAVRSQGRSPLSVTLDGYAASHRAVREPQQQGRLAEQTKLRSSKYPNNLIEQDHRNIKSRLGAMLGLKSFESAAVTICGVELMHRIRKAQFDLRALGTHGQTPPGIWEAVLAA